MIKSFRGQIADGSEVRIRLGTNNGLTGYKISKFQIITSQPGGGSDYESLIKINSQSLGDLTVTPVTTTVNFDNPLLLAVAYSSGDSASVTAVQETVIFDNVKFNQDIYITHVEQSGSQACNYYIELEQVKLDLNEATVATLKDMRGRE